MFQLSPGYFCSTGDLLSEDGKQRYYYKLAFSWKQTYAANSAWTFDGL